MNPATPGNTPPPLPGWPFLVTRGILLGYRVVIAPEFLVTAGDSDAVFASAQTGPGIATTGPMLRVVQTAKGEPLTLVYRQRPAAVDELGAIPLRDRHGRPFPLIEGWVVRGIYDRIPVTDEQWQELHQIVVTDYREYLANEAQGPMLISSRGQSLTLPAAPEAPPPNPLNPKPGPLSNSQVIIVVFSSVAAVVLLIVLLSR